VDFVKLVNIDLAKFDDEEGRKEIARDLYNAAVGHGFLTLTNHGISDEVYMHQMQLANAVMTLPPPEKVPYEGLSHSPACRASLILIEPL
jgi:isopenicillin N synthase-like dioxygenase